MWSDLLYHLSNPESITPFGWAMMVSGVILIVTYLALVGRVTVHNAAEKAGGGFN